MELNLKDKVAIVTGGNKGFGGTSARLLAKEGARLVLTARNAEHLDDTANRLRNDYNASVVTISADLTDSDGGAKIAQSATDAFGRIDILVNCAGASQGGNFADIPDEIWEASMALKFMGTIRMIRAVLPTMQQQRYGRIVNVAGNTGKQPAPMMLPGAAANAALLAVTAGLAQGVAGDGIVINAVNPGPSRTERWNTLMQNMAASGGKTVAEIEAGIMADIPMNRLGEAEEIANLIVFLASDVAANMTGTSLTADGGWTKAMA